MNILEIKIKKEELKEIARKSLLFSISPDELNDFLTLVDSIEENETGLEKIKFLYNQFTEEKEAILSPFKKIREN